MSECRALANLCGNGVATLAIAAWEKQLDRDALQRELSGGVDMVEAEDVNPPAEGPRARRA
jgi:aerobic C4-dicarboxylate transport protein